MENHRACNPSVPFELSTASGLFSTGDIARSIFYKCRGSREELDPGPQSRGKCESSSSIPALSFHTQVGLPQPPAHPCISGNEQPPRLGPPVSSGRRIPRKSSSVFLGATVFSAQGLEFSWTTSRPRAGIPHQPGSSQLAQQWWGQLLLAWAPQQADFCMCVRREGEVASNSRTHL